MLSSLDIPSLVIGAGIVGNIWVLHYIYWPKKSPFVPTECLRKAGSRKEDKGVWTEHRAKRTHFAFSREGDKEWNVFLKRKLFKLEKDDGE